MARALREVGFELVDGNAHLNVSGDEMKRLIIKFGQILKQSGGVGLFYYAGHGIQVGGKNYLIPIEAEALREQTVEFDAVDVNRVLGEMDYAGNGFNIVILDACRSNPFTRSWRSSESGLASISAPEGTLIAYATSPGRVASDGTTRNGIYTEQLLKQMHVPGLSLETVFKAVRANVKAISKGQQIPWESSSIVGDFYFTRGTSPKSAEAQEPATSISPSAIEFAYWESIKNSNDPEDFKGYLAKYPSGQFASIAQRRLSVREASFVSNELGDSLEVVSFEPSLPARFQVKSALNAAAENKVFIKVNYRLKSHASCRIFVSALYHYKIPPNSFVCPSPVYYKGDGTATNCFGLYGAGRVTQLQIEMKSEDNSETILSLLIYVNAVWSTSLRNH
jgi:hypothetical protein